MKNVVLTVLKDHGVWFFVALGFVSGGFLYAQTKSGGKTLAAIGACLVLAAFCLDPELILSKIVEVVVFVVKLLKFG